ncbi:ParB/RepB/Spo0J family partition protein [Alphaproteobacteria bacterium]|nr:ParB/RepB/Spo0J family partition protein [Alphaproteobacteria bacterium]
MNNLSEEKPILPYFLDDFIFSDYRVVKLENIYIGYAYPNNTTQYKSIFSTPHFKLAKYLCNPNEEDLNLLKQDYKQYHSNSDESEKLKKFMNLIFEIQSNGYNWKDTPILVLRNWRRPLPLNRYDVADGFHRLAILAALGYEDIKVARLHYKMSILKRFAKRFNKLK